MAKFAFFFECLAGYLSVNSLCSSGYVSVRPKRGASHGSRCSGGCKGKSRSPCRCQHKRTVDAWPANGTDFRPNLTMVGRYRAIEAASAAELRALKASLPAKPL